MQIPENISAAIDVQPELQEFLIHQSNPAKH
jgi:hypothetical protein